MKHIETVNGPVTTVFYQNEDTALICSLLLSQRTTSTPDPIQIISPGNTVKESLYRIESKSTSHQIIVHQVRNGTLVDYVNGIALCLIKAGVPCDIPVASKTKDSVLILSLENNKVVYFKGKDGRDVEKLCEMCREKYKEMKIQLNLG